ncbi:MAG: hypothetical protein PWP31_477 [Clostridia bacterium]|nr:hypothetical protein [Clostridia bacterium]
METKTQARVPWSTQPSLKEKTNEVGIDFDKFIAGLAANRSDTELAKEFGVNSEAIYHLRNHFERYGIQSVMGQD